SASGVQWDYRVIAAAVDETLRVSLIGFAGSVFQVDSVNLAPAGSWITNHSAPIVCSGPRNRIYRVTLQIINGSGTQDSVAGIDNVRVLANGPVFPPDVNADGVVDIDDLLAVINAWGATGAPGTIPADVNHDGVV